MIKLAIVVGHTERQPGASGVSPIDSSEYAWNSDLAAMIVDHVAQVDDAEAKVFFRDSGGMSVIKTFGTSEPIR
ncbi:MAG: hypothetical protein OXT06_22140 [Rhodospirillaceae bacterium]|nr:hypothetical protein [Rhodospirillaceae bacterium]